MVVLTTEGSGGFVSNQARTGEGGGPPTIRLRVQTPRGLWSMTTPEDADIRPEYVQSAKVQQVIDDARRVFGFDDSDSKYSLVKDNEVLAGERTLISYGLTHDVLLILTVQGGNA